VWDSAFAPCPAACSHGACAAAQCTTDADCPPWPPTCVTTECLSPLYWAVNSCPVPTCVTGTCQCPYGGGGTWTSCGAGDTACADGMCVPGDGGTGDGGTGDGGP
jgi:hypothetical protein